MSARAAKVGRRQTAQGGIEGTFRSAPAGGTQSCALPPGPRAPAFAQTLAIWAHPIRFIERCRTRYGPRFTLRPFGQPPLVVLTRPQELAELFRAPADVLCPGSGARLLEPLIGSRSLILLDGDEHLAQRKLLLPAFHGRQIERLSKLIAGVIDGAVARWPRGVTLALHPRLTELTLEIMLRAVFGLKDSPRLERLRALMTEVLAFAANPLTLTPLPTDGALARWGPVAAWHRRIAATDEQIYALIAERRRERADGDDVLALLLQARYEDGSPMSDPELRDELMTMLVAGHETSATQLAWAFERLARRPDVLARLQGERQVGEGDGYLTATIQEIQRCWPVLPFTQPRVVAQPFAIGEHSYPPGVSLSACIYLLHHDPAIYADPYAFRPERFIEQPPGTYTWIPFGGGRRRCLGASLAMLEMKLAIVGLLAHHRLRPASRTPERARMRSITIRPVNGGRVKLLAKARSA